MNIYKVYDNWHKANNWMRYYTDFNQATISKIRFSEMKVEMKNGSNIYFKVVKNIEDAYNLSGCIMDWLELDSGSVFSNDVEQWLKVRVRG